MIRFLITTAAYLASTAWICAAESTARLPAVDEAAGIARIGSIASPTDPTVVFDGQAGVRGAAFEPPVAPGAEEEPQPFTSEETILELFAEDGEETQKSESDDSSESEAEGQTPTSPDTVFNSQASARQGFHQVFVPYSRVPYLGPRGRDGTPPGTTNAWVQHPCQGSHGNYYRSADGTWLGNDKICDVSGAFNDPYDTALRFGWWGTNNDGSLRKIGEYQDLDSSPFWDIDMIRSDGQRTIDFWMSGLDEDANSARGSFYAGPGLSVKLRYERFLHRLDHDPLYGAPIAGPLGPADNVVTEELNVGEDYAIRVQQLDTRFQGRINENLKWRVNVWSQRKFGERQANATAHCFDVDPTAATNNVCHVLSQRQNIDWQTFEIQPVLEANFGNATVEYSHTLRAFGQNDQIVDRQYDHFSPFNLPGNQLGPPFRYAFVPDSNTNIDRLKLGWILNNENHIYGSAYYGLTENTFRNTSRQYTGFDVRYTNRMLDRLTLTTYVNTNADNNESAPFLIVGDPAPPAPAGRGMQHPVDHIRTRAGIKGNWQPIEGLEDRLSIASGYEYFQHERDFAVYSSSALGTYRQPDTSSNMIELGPQVRWSRAINTFVRYKAWFVDEPLVGVREGDGRFNTNQPEQEHRVEVGGSWNPTTNFMTTAQFSIVNRWNTSPFANFSEDNYPFTWTMWYAPTQKLSFSGGYGYYSNWIDQDISLGYRFNLGDQTETTRWQYAGDNHIVNLNMTYAWTPNVQFVGGAEWSRGNNVFTVPASPAGADWSQLNTFSDVLIEQTRFTAGADWQPYDHVTLYLRYVYFDWNDIAANLDSGTSHMGLAGAGIVF